MGGNKMEIIQTTDHEIISLLNKEIHDLHVTLYPDHFKEYNYEIINDFFNQIMNKPEHIFLLLTEEDKCLGYSWIEIRQYPSNPFRKPYKSVFVHHISIVKEAQNKGLGKGLLNRIYEIAKEQGIEKIELDYWTDNEIAKQFYEKNGFIKYREFVYKDLS
jgi:ribosomal protein S18 acetylase RimI-like enzyme